MVGYGLPLHDIAREQAIARCRRMAQLEAKLCSAGCSFCRGAALRPGPRAFCPARSPAAQQELEQG